MLASSFVLSLLSAAAYAQSTASVVDIEAEQANFDQSLIVPELLTAFNPTAVLSVTFSGNATSYGEQLTVDQVSAQPNITLTPSASGASAFNSSSVFTVAMVDAGYAGQTLTEQTRHWLTNNVKLIGDSAPYTLNYTTDAITSYGGPYPASGSGPHRYTILLMPQPSTFVAPAGLNTSGVAISTFDFPSYVNSTGLDQPVAGFFFTVEVGTATVTPSATSAVVTSTLASSAASSGTAAGALGSASGEVSSAAAKATSAAASASSSASTKSGASQAVSFPKAIVGLAGAAVGLALLL